MVLGADPVSVSDILASEKAFIDYDLCINCGRCVDVCRFSSIIAGEKPVVVRYSCEGCGACSIICPVDAIEIKPVVNGRLNLLSAGRNRVIAGELCIGESSSGRLVDMVKKHARRAGEEIGADLILTDGPPGIGCPVIATLKGADYVILVTEPTPSALNDLQRVVEMINDFHLPIGIVLNRSDMYEAGRNRIRQYISRQGFELLAEIPYDPQLPCALAEGTIAVTARPDAPSSVVIRQLSRKVDMIIRQFAEK